RAARAASRPASAAASRLERVTEGFLDELRTGRRLSPHTLDAYARDLADYQTFAREAGLEDWEQATPTLVDGYFAALLKPGLSSPTAAPPRAATRRFHA